MKEISVNFNKIIGEMKIMHAVNNGPVWKATADQRISNMDAYREAGFPYARNHDASFFSMYGGEHTVDVHMIFPDFDKDPYDPDSYDFHLTDEYCQVIKKGGAEVFYRLGSKIEHETKKYGTLPPKDFKKWAVICEHIIKHLNYGWADGLHLGIEYWEIWNEPDLDTDDSTHKRCWGGTKKEFIEFYNVAATHLKEKFPELKIGGPASSGNWEWMEDFLSELKAPLDFFSWHVYGDNPERVEKYAIDAKKLLEKHGYSNVESILNEWNYIKGWEDDDFIYSMDMMRKTEGAAFVTSSMCLCQHAPVDMLMYYDARPSGYSMFDTIIFSRCYKNYYPFKMFNTLYKLKNEAELILSDNIYGLAAKNENEAAIMLTHFNRWDNRNSNIGEYALKINDLNLGSNVKAEIYLLDDKHDLELIKEENINVSDFTLNLEFDEYTEYLIKFIKM